MVEKNDNVFYKLRDEYDSDHEKLSVTALAEEFGVSRTTISKLENNKLKGLPSVELLKLYRKKFHVTYEYLFGETEAKKLENYVVGKDLGLNDEAIETLKELKLYPNKMTIVNAFMGLGEDTVMFFTNLFQSLYDQYEYNLQLQQLDPKDPEYSATKYTLELFRQEKHLFFSKEMEIYFNKVACRLIKAFERERQHELDRAYYEMEQAAIAEEEEKARQNVEREPVQAILIKTEEMNPTNHETDSE